MSLLLFDKLAFVIALNDFFLVFANEKAFVFLSFLHEVELGLLEFVQGSVVFN